MRLLSAIFYGRQQSSLIIHTLGLAGVSFLSFVCLLLEAVLYNSLRTIEICSHTAAILSIQIHGTRPLDKIALDKKGIEEMIPHLFY